MDDIRSTVNIKYQNLLEFLKELDKVMIAFSGGVDSTFLLKALVDALGTEKVVALTVVSPYIPNWEIEEAKACTEDLGVRHEFLKVGISDEIKTNPENRCYLCKKSIFSEIKKRAMELGFEHVVDGTNFDDLGDYRPGLKALKELEIISPLLKFEMTKDEIRLLSKKMELNTWNKPPYACLLTRIPHGTEITENSLRMIEKSEKYLFDKGIYAVRVRIHGDLARIELGQKERNILSNEALLKDISSKFKEIGFRYVTIDIDGYKMGSFNTKGSEVDNG
jgi:uncharacterized protein